MMVEAALMKLWLRHPAVATLVGNRVYARIFPRGAAMPAIVYQRISTVGRNLTLSGASGVAQARFQVTCRADGAAEPYKTALTLADAVRLASEGYRGTIDGQEILSITVDGQSAGYAYDPEAETSAADAVNLDLLVWYREAVGIRNN